MCDECLKVFKNDQCYDRHKENGSCSKFVRCIQCNKIWDRERFLKGEKPEHKCDENFCKRCCKFKSVFAELKIFKFSIKFLDEVHATKKGCFIGRVLTPEEEVQKEFHRQKSLMEARKKKLIGALNDDTQTQLTNPSNILEGESFIEEREENEMIFDDGESLEESLENGEEEETFDEEEEGESLEDEEISNDNWATNLSPADKELVEKIRLKRDYRLM